MPTPRSAGRSESFRDRRRSRSRRTGRRRHRFRRWSGRRTCCRFSRAPMSRTGPRQGAGGLRRLPWRKGRLAVAGISAPGRAIGRRDLQAAVRLSDGQPTHPLMTDVAKALDESEIADVAAYYAGQPQRNPNPVTLAPSLARRSCSSSSWAIPAAIFRPARLPSPGIRRPDRDADPCRARTRIPGAAIAALCVRRAAQRRLCAGCASSLRELTPAEIEGLAAYYRAGFR